MSPTEENLGKGEPPSFGKKLLFSAVGVLFTVVMVHVISYFGIRHQNRQSFQRLAKSLETTIPHFVDYLAIQLDFVHPYLKVTFIPNQRLAFCRINQQGYRGPDFVREKASAFRVAIIGGSAAMGWFANSEEETVHSRLKAALERAFPSEQFEIYNFAVFQYNSTQELFVLETEALTYSPDFVIILSGMNDFGWAVVEKPWQPRYPLGWIHIRAIVDPSHFQEGYTRRPWLLRNSFKWSFLAQTAWQNLKIRSSPVLLLSNLVHHRRTDQFVAFGETEFNLVGARTGLWAENMELMGRLLDSYSIPYCVSLQPCGFYRRQLAESEMAVATLFICGEKDLETARRYWTTAWDAAQRALTSRRYKINVLDLTGCFDSVREATYFEYCHYNRVGTDIIAQRYTEHLRPFVEKWKAKKSLASYPAQQASPSELRHAPTQRD